MDEKNPVQEEKQPGWKKPVATSIMGPYEYAPGSTYAFVLPPTSDELAEQKEWDEWDVNPK